MNKLDKILTTGALLGSLITSNVNASEESRARKCFEPYQTKIEQLLDINRDHYTFPQKKAIRNAGLYTHSKNDSFDYITENKIKRFIGNTKKHIPFVKELKYNLLNVLSIEPMVLEGFKDCNVKKRSENIEPFFENYKKTLGEIIDEVTLLKFFNKSRHGSGALREKPHFKSNEMNELVEKYLDYNETEKRDKFNYQKFKNI